MAKLLWIGTLSRALCVSCSFAIACGGSSPPANDAAGASPNHLVLEVDGDPNGIWWDEASATLYLADDNGDRILTWTDTAGFSVLREIPVASSDKGGLGQIVRAKDGSLVVTRFGSGQRGGVIVLPVAGEARSVPGLDVARRRIGLTVAEDGTFYDAWFVKLDAGGRKGGVSRLSLTGGEVDVIEGLKKPVGVLAIGDQLFASDQDLDQIVVAPRSGSGAPRPFATIPRPDLLAPGANGSIYSASASGSVYRIAASGEAAVFHSGFRQVRGVAYDASRHRLFVADHDADESDGMRHLLHVLPDD